MYPVNLIPKSNPEKRTGLILASKQTLSKHTPRIFALKSYPDKRTSRNLTRTLSRKASPPNPYLKIHLLKTYLTNLTPKCYPDERTRLNLDKKGNRWVRAPELFREFRAASIFAHPTLGRRAFPSFVVCLKWAEVYGLRRGRAA